MGDGGQDEKKELKSIRIYIYNHTYAEGGGGRYSRLSGGLQNRIEDIQ